MSTHNKQFNRDKKLAGFSLRSILAHNFLPVNRALGIKESMDDNIKVGDWVRSYGSGIWRVHRILELNDFDIQSQTNKPRTVIFSSRFVNDSYKRSFSTESCDSCLLYTSDAADE